jgi:molybdenum cofactor cytidylyltransferase
VTGSGVDRAQVAVVLLAAGRSQRFGVEDKLLATLGGSPLAIHSARAINALGAGLKLAVCAPTSATLAQALAAEGFEIVINPNPDHGLSSSIACGIGHVIETAAEAALIGLADMPFVTPEHLQLLLDRFDRVIRPVVSSSADGVAMPPALFARSEFGKLMKLGGDKGARALLAAGDTVPTGTQMLRDIDHPMDLPTQK